MLEQVHVIGFVDHSLQEVYNHDKKVMVNEYHLVSPPFAFERFSRNSIKENM
jgi:hypothetical protein